MSLTSFGFFEFLLVSIVVYYFINNKYRKYWLLICSLFFYYKNCSTYKLFILIGFVTIDTYIGALLIEKANKKRKKIYTFLSIFLLVLVLFYIKYLYNIVSVINYIFKFGINCDYIKVFSVLGISYYTLSAIGYLIEVFWGNIEADKNYVNVALFILFFPQLISGPITRYSSFSKEINRIHKLDYDNITHGVRRMILGYLKKLVISETFVLVVNEVFGHPFRYNIVGIGVGVLCYAVRLYTDFSGCMDIIIGAASLYDIRLPENFNAPLMSKSLKEFWQRWHITLGAWFKDYVMYPIQASKVMISISKFCRRKMGKQLGKKVSFYLSMMILWFLLGIWHGAEPYYFVASGVIPCVFLIITDLFFKDKKIDNNRSTISIINSLITLLLVCVCWYVVCCESLHVSIDVAYSCVKELLNLSKYQFYPLNIERNDLIIMIFSVMFIYYLEYKQYYGKTVFDILDKYNFVIKYILISCELLMILFMGKVGTTTFIYFQF